MRTSKGAKFVAVVMAGTLVLGACGDDEKAADTTAAPTTAGGGGGSDDPLAALYQECLDNGAKVNLIALPDEWANYKGILASFGEKYPGVEYPVANPDASSADEMNAVETLSGQADMPDNVDVSPAIAQEMVDKGLFEPYTLSVDSEVPAGLKDADHNWSAAYYGIMAIITNTTIVPNADHVRRPGEARVQGSRVAERRPA